MIARIAAITQANAYVGSGLVCLVVDEGRSLGIIRRSEIINLSFLSFDEKIESENGVEIRQK